MTELNIRTVPGGANHLNDYHDFRGDNGGIDVVTTNNK